LNGAKVWSCDKATFDNEVQNHCIPLYNQSMASSNYQKECPWPTTKGETCLMCCHNSKGFAATPKPPPPSSTTFSRMTEGHYAQLDACVRNAADHAGCMETSLKNELFLELHRTYFSLCFFMQDPDVHVVLLLVLPCIITTFLLPFCCAHLTSAAY
ncbi:hypothetical protein P4O66_015156, partial [Electrophorus voltai]